MKLIDSSKKSDLPCGGKEKKKKSKRKRKGGKSEGSTCRDRVPEGELFRDGIKNDLIGDKIGCGQGNFPREN